MKRFRTYRTSQEVRDKYADVSVDVKDFIYPYFVVEGKGVRDILLREKRIPCGNPAYNRDVGYFSSCEIEGIIHNFDGAGLRGVFSDISVLLQGFKVGMNGRRGAEMDGLADFTDRGRKSAGENLVFDIVKNFFLFVGDFSFCHNNLRGTGNLF